MTPAEGSTIFLSVILSLSKEQFSLNHSIELIDRLRMEEADDSSRKDGI
jgi:hypothetical protein